MLCVCQEFISYVMIMMDDCFILSTYQAFAGKKEKSKQGNIYASADIMEVGTENEMSGKAGEICREYGFYISWRCYCLGCEGTGKFF